MEPFELNMSHLCVNFKVRVKLRLPFHYRWWSSGGGMLEINIESWRAVRSVTLFFS